MTQKASASVAWDVYRFVANRRDYERRLGFLSEARREQYADIVEAIRQQMSPAERDAYEVEQWRDVMQKARVR